MARCVWGKRWLVISEDCWPVGRRGPKSCSMQLTHQIRDAGMQEKSVEFRKAAEIYIKT